jgi:hypothetical protein
MSVLILAVLLACADASTQPATPRGHDPWVFRCTLDDKPRMVVAALAPDWWIAFDAQAGAFHKAWVGQVNFTGTVYDTRHGPQPKSIGDALFATEPVRILPAASDSPIDIRWRWRGYRFIDGEVQFELSGAAPDGRELTLTLSPRILGEPDAPSGLRLVAQATGLRSGERAVLTLVDLDRDRVARGRIGAAEPFPMGARFEMRFTPADGPAVLDLEVAHP